MPVAHNTRRLALLAGLLVVLAVILTVFFANRQTARDAASSSNSPASRSGQARTHDGTVKQADAVRLDELSLSRPDPVDSERNPFRFRSRAAAPVSPRPVPSYGRGAGPGPDEAPVAPVAPPVPPGPPPLPPIPLKFIGIVDAPAQGGKLAVLSDGRGAPLYGHENDVIDGRYKIIRIGVESIDISYADGRGRQTIRLTGQ
jgi:hypothetical protein